MEPGIYYDIPNGIYHSWDGCSASRLKPMRQSPMHCFYEMTHPEEKEPTPALIKGSVIHCAILEPERFGVDYAPSSPCEAIKKNGDRCTNEARGVENGIWLCGVHGKFFEGNKIILEADFYDSCIRLGNMVRTHKTARNFFEVEYQVEVSAIWKDSTHGILCKMRADMLCPELATIVDIKSVEDASKVEFSKQIWNYDYHIQNCFYLKGMQALGQDYRFFVFIAVEKNPPHGIAVYSLDRSSLEAGEYHMNEYMARYAECQKNNYWPSYDEGLHIISLPKYATTEIFKTA